MNVRNLPALAVGEGSRKISPVKNASLSGQEDRSDECTTRILIQIETEWRSRLLKDFKPTGRNQLC
jgi:hypothetical protein